jgi:hypothetical protein
MDEAAMNACVHDPVRQPTGPMSGLKSDIAELLPDGYL